MAEYIYTTPYQRGFLQSTHTLECHKQNTGMLISEDAVTGSESLYIFVIKTYLEVYCLHFQTELVLQQHLMNAKEHVVYYDSSLLGTCTSDMT